MERRQKGLAWKRTADVVRDFVRAHADEKPRRAVLCTYDFHPQPFDTAVFAHLERRAFRTLVIADAIALRDRLTDRAFKRYEVAPARCRGAGVFHAKAILIRAGSRFLVGIGSANLTAGGLGGNLELMFFADHTTVAGKGLACGLAHFFQRLAESNDVSVPRPAASFLEKMFEGIQGKAGILLDTLETPLLPQMIRVCSKACSAKDRSLTIVSPWHGSGASPDHTEAPMIEKLRQKLSICREVNVYTSDADSGRGPDLGRDVNVRVPRQSEPLPKERDADDPEADIENRAYYDRPRTLHAKAYLVGGARKAVLFFGSANCTHPALLQSVQKGGNVEILLPSRLATRQEETLRRDLDAFFEPARKMVASTPLRASCIIGGSVLAGYIVARAREKLLRIEAPALPAQAVVLISAKPEGPTVTVTIDKGIGEVTSQQELGRLFPSGVPDRSSNAWTSVLWEKVLAKWIPFPVTVPLAASTCADPVDALDELLDEHAGRWPRRRATGDESFTICDDGESGESTEDEDDHALTAADHQGELDRIAVRIARLKRLFPGNGQQGMVPLHLVRRIVAIVDSHLRPTVRRFLRRDN